MAANVFGNVFRRGRDVARVVLRRQAGPAPPVNKTDNVRQPAIYTALVRCQTPVVPSRIGLFIRTNVSIYKTLASQLRRRVAFEYGRPNGRTIPFLGFVGVALSASNQDQDDSLSGKIRDVVQKRIKNIPITQQLRLDSLDLGNVIGQGCNSDWFDGQLQQLQRDITTLINASDFVENPRLPQIVPSKEEEREDKWYPPIKENSQREITDDLSNCKLSTTSSCEESFVAINEDRDVVQKIDNSPTIQQLHLEILDLDKCNHLDDIEREITSLENASDFVENPSLPHILPLIKEEEEKIVPLINEEEEKIVPLINEEESEDKWFPPAEENSQREISDGSICCGSSCKLSISSSCDDGFVVIDADRESSFCKLEADENSVPKSFPLCSSDSDSMMSSDTDTSRECDSCPETSSKVEDDKWSVMDELDYPESMMSVDSDTDLKNDSSSVTSNEDDKWSVMDGLDYKESMMSVDSDTDLENDSSSVTSNEDDKWSVEDDKWSVMDGLDYKGAVPDIVKCLTKSMLCRDPKKRTSPVDAANIMQMYLWCPAEWFVYKPNVNEVRGHLLILLGVNDLCPEHQLMATFLQRHNLNDIIRVLDSFAEVDE